MRKLTVVFILIALIIITSGVKSYANVSSAAVLFLRIAAGARAAGMGEAFVAVADDATATHWNPAGLGSYPLSGKWFEIRIPQEFRPIQKTAIYKNESSDIDYRRFDIWAITPKGLVKYSKGNWYLGDRVETSIDMTSEMVLRQYAGLVGEVPDAKMADLMERMGKANNASSKERIDSLKEAVMKTFAVGDSSKIKGDLDSSFTLLQDAYNKCLIDWDIFQKASDQYHDAFKDSSLSESELDKILFAVEKARLKYLPRELMMPYDISISGNLSDIAADDNNLWVATDSGLYRYSGDGWQSFNVDKGLPTRDIRLIRMYDKKAYLGTRYGLVVYDKGAFTYYNSTYGLPEAPVDGIIVENSKSVWTLINSDLYHYDGKTWKNYYEYNDVLGETDSSVYDRIKIFGTAGEQEKFLVKYGTLNSPDFMPIAAMAADSADSASAVVNMVDSLGITGAIQAGQDSAKTDSLAVPKEQKEAAPGKLLRIPYLIDLKFAVTDMEVDSHGALLIGTENGLFRYAEKKWTRLGYRDYKPDSAITIFDLAMQRVRNDSSRAERLAENIKIANELVSDTILAGQNIKIYANPAGSHINDIEQIDNRVYFATKSGVIYYDGSWARYTAEGLGVKDASAIRKRGGDVWIMVDDRIFVRAGAKSEVAMMHVNWLPELANDIYYEFFSYVRHVEGWGTVGGNITFLSYGKITRTDEGNNILGDFSAFDVAMTLSYGSALSSSLSGGLSAKVIYSHLSSIGSGKEKGSGTSTGLALDVGLMYRLNRRTNLGLAITNIGPDISYIDVAQADPLPRNLAVGLAWKMIESPFNKVLLTAEANKSMVAMGDGFSQEIKEVVLNGGIEYWYGSFIAFRGGYIYDQEGEIKTPTLGVGLAYKLFKFDFAYIPSSDNVPLANTMRFSLSIGM
jgi:hypothetical protein